MKAKSIISNIRKLCFISMTILLSGACSDEPVYSGNPDNEEGIKIHIKVPAPAISRTRTDITSDDYYNADAVYLLLFDGSAENSKLLQRVKTSAGTGNTLYAKLKADPNAQHAYVVANVEHLVGNWEENTTLSTIKEELKMILPQTEGVLTAMVTPQPMIGYASLEEGIQENTTIGTEESPVFLTRATAKISIYNRTDNMSLEGANLVNAPTTGYLFERPEKLSAIAKAHSGKAGNREEMLVTPAADEQNCTLYTFESDETKSTAIVIKAKYLGITYFYRLDLNTKASEYALKRNYNYIVTIKAVKKQGHTTAEEAIQNPASNLEYDINVVDAYSKDITGNGQYYLGVSNTEFYAFTDDNITKDEIICTITHNAPTGIVGRFEVTEGGIVLSENSFPAGNGMEQNITLKIKSVPSNFTKGEINVILGNLERTITVYKEKQPSKFGTLLSSFIKKGYISGVTDAKNQDWLKLTTTSVESELTEEAQHNRLEDAGENINIRVKANMGDDSSPKYRTGHVDLFRKDQIGNARIMIKQPVHDIYTEIQGQAKIDPYTYVGTFHRHDQTGERIIRVKTDITGTGAFKWQVRVLSGDFIRLSNEQSGDNGVKRDFYGVGDHTTNFGYAVEQYKVNGSMVINNPAEAKDIYFRVGLTSTIAQAATRYGILGLFVNEDIDKDKVTRYIFVRQGESADYLMRPQDPAESEPHGTGESVIMPERPLAVKFSPFNLTDKRTPNEAHSNLSGTRGTFADYPSQAGYLYQAITGKGWWADPVNTPTISDWVTSPVLPANWNTAHETCPEGYFRPKGDKNGASYGTARATESSMRQSLWLYPKDGGISNTQNFIIGYIADGFYDRQPMWHKPPYTGPEIKQLTAVNHDSQIAYMGVLAFNPRTLSSLFLPLAGYYYAQSSYRFDSAGYSGGFYTQSRTPDSYWFVDYGMMSAANPSDGTYQGTKFRVDNYATHNANQASNIRCVQN